MTDARPVLLCFDGSEDARRAIDAAGRLLAPRPAVVLTVWEAARDITALDPLGDAVGRLSGIYAELDEAGLHAAREAAERGVSRHAGRPVLVVPPPDDQPGGAESPRGTSRTD
jgi:hypothetical protein